VSVENFVYLIEDKEVRRNRLRLPKTPEVIAAFGPHCKWQNAVCKAAFASHSTSPFPSVSKFVAMSVLETKSLCMAILLIISHQKVFCMASTL
jgi:hypothetical protein